ncbi:TolC family protein [Foetidibacter luteolus]|uniref:TolC family protein n=1 Tax=Foetidibacter luteolus TaxID=2608880 RepID=UPI00129ACBEF|nr:TolC family protein [Foetidibacter luteolus]
MKQFLHQPAIRRVLMVLMLAAAYCSASAQTDTSILKLSEVEKIFLDSNLSVLAAHYNVDANKAYIQQAKLWDNPILTTDQNIYADGKFFEHGKNAAGQPAGQFFVQVQQLIKTAGKRSKLVDLATTNAKLSELQLQQVLHNLRYQLRQDYYTLVQQLADKALYNSQLEQLTRLQTAMKAQLQNGNIAQKDYLRIQAVVIALQQDITDLNRSILDAEADLKTLLRFNTAGFIVPADTTQPEPQLAGSIEETVASAKQNNPGYLLQQTQLLYQQQNLVYQKALRSPDLTVGPEYDHNSNYAPHYVGLTISLPLPLFNKNQGNIKAAEYSIKQQEAVTSEAENILSNNISNAWQKLQLSIQQNNATQKEFYGSYGNIFNNMLQSYRQKQISLLEFLDFFDAYKEAQLRLQQQQLNLRLAKEELNYQAGTDIIP